MAVLSADESIYHTAIDLILPRPLKCYCAPMRSGHWQLRSLISTPRQNIIIYPHGKDITILNTETRETYLLATLKFEPRCLTSSNEWVCCGGENGNYTAIKFSQEISSETERYLGLDAEPHTRLPLDLDPFWASEPFQRQNRDFRPIAELTRNVGSQIVNNISIWFPSDISTERTYKEPVAIVSSNDQSISILKLEDTKIIEKLALPDCVNRSLISPDGDLLVSVCDDPFLYIHRRKSRRINKTNGYQSRKSEFFWSLEGRVQLEGQILGDRSLCKGSFAASFSPSGKYLAVATQYGIISIFDSERIFAPPVSIFTASRINSSGEGYIRAMEFCNGSFDLLAWTESKGRIGVADVRNLFLSRQILFLDSSHLEDVQKISINDRLIDSQVSPGSLRSNSVYRVMPDHSGLDIGTNTRRQSRPLTRNAWNAISHRRAQLQVLDPHFARQQRERSIVNGETSTIPTWISSIEARRPIYISHTANSLRSGRSSNAGLPATLREFLSQDRAPSFRSFINERNRDHERRSQQDQEQDVENPSRSSTRTYFSPLIDVAALAAHENFRANRDATVNLESLNLSSSQGQDLRSEGHWPRINSLQQRSSTLSSPTHGSSRSHVEAENEDHDETENRMDELIDFALLDAQHVYQTQSRRSRSNIFATTGCCWSLDGRILYVATEDNIYEFHVNMRGRKLFPSLAFC